MKYEIFNVDLVGHLARKRGSFVKRKHPDISFLVRQEVLPSLKGGDRGMICGGGMASGRALIPGHRVAHPSTQHLHGDRRTDGQMVGSRNDGNIQKLF